MNDEEAMDETKQGNETAFGAIWARWWEPLVRFFAGRGVPPDDEQGCAGKTLWNVWRSREIWHEQDPNRCFPNFIWTIARNVLIDYWRQRRLMPILDDSLGMDPFSCDSSDAAEVLIRLFHARRLPEKQQLRWRIWAETDCNVDLLAAYHEYLGDTPPPSMRPPTDFATWLVKCAGELPKRDWANVRQQAGASAGNVHNVCQRLLKEYGIFALDRWPQLRDIYIELFQDDTLLRRWYYSPIQSPCNDTIDKIFRLKESTIAGSCDRHLEAQSRKPPYLFVPPLERNGESTEPDSEYFDNDELVIRWTYYRNRVLDHFIFWFYPKRGRT